MILLLNYEVGLGKEQSNKLFHNKDRGFKGCTVTNRELKIKIKYIYMGLT